MLIVIIAGATVGLCNAFVVVKWLSCPFEGCSLIEVLERAGLVGMVFLISSLPVGLLWAAFFAAGAVGFAKLVGSGAGSLVGLIIGPPKFLLLATGGLILLPWEWIATVIGAVVAIVSETLLVNRYNR